MDQPVYAATKILIDAIARGLRARRADGIAEVLDRLAAQELDPAHFHRPEAHHLPVLRGLAGALAETAKLDGELAAALAAMVDYFSWRQARYSDPRLESDFNANLVWCEIIGPHGFFPGEDFLLGLLFLSERRHYPDHHHPAPELYWPLTAGTQWRQGETGFEAKSAGDVIWHRPNVAHATKTGAAPMLAVWCWPRDIATPAKMVG